MGLPINKSASERERPSRHGALLGKALATIEAAGRATVQELPPMCSTCAFREGCMTNQMAGTLMEALRVLLGIEGDTFACHHGMIDGRPTKVCAGYHAAKHAPWPDIQREVCGLSVVLSEQAGPDEIRAHFDAWIERVDPDNRMDDYERGRAYQRYLRPSGASA